MEIKIRFPFEGRYHTLGDRSGAKQIWFVLHGYGQLAGYFIKRFKALEKEKIFVVAPEGLSRFYVEDTASRMQTGNMKVGASWMTREDRLTDIQNYLAYLNEIYHHVIGQQSVATTILGFSQGAATATRWALSGAVKFEKLVLWAGIFPPDIDFSKAKEILKTKSTFLVYGTKDPFLNDERFAEMKLLSEKLAITPQQLAFDGAHTIDEPTLLKLI